MYELSLLCVDRTFLLISWDPSCVNAGNMPFPLVVRSLDRGTHLLEFAGSILWEKERHQRILPILFRMCHLFLTDGFLRSLTDSNSETSLPDIRVRVAFAILSRVRYTKTINLGQDGVCL